MRVGCLQGVAEGIGLELVVPPPQLCTDNGVMVAWAGAERLALGLWEHLPASAADDAWVDVRPRWPLTDQCVASYSTCLVRRSIGPTQHARGWLSERNATWQLLSLAVLFS